MSPYFYYRGYLLRANKTVEGNVTCQTLKEAISQISKKHPDISSLIVKEIPKYAPLTIASYIYQIITRPSRVELIVFFNQLATTLHYGIPLLAALKAIGKGHRRFLKEMILQLANAIQEGISLSNAMTFYPRAFPQLTISLVKSGETSGKLSTVIKRIAEIEETSLYFRKNIIGAFIYPIILFVVSTVLLFVSLSVLLPQTMSILRDLNVTPPSLTLILYKLLLFFKNPIFWIVSIIFALLCAGIVWWEPSLPQAYGAGPYFKEKKQILKTLLFNIPIVRDLMRKGVLLQISYTLGMLLKSGISLTQALILSKQILIATPFSKSLTHILKCITNGKTFAEAITGTHFHIPLFYNLITVGEHSGKLDFMLLKIAELYEVELYEKLNTLTRFLEPFILIIVGIIIGVVAIASFLPYFTLLKFV